LSQLLDRYEPAMSLVADVIVLTEDAAQIAAGEEYRPGSPATDKDAFLAKMRTYGTDYGRFANAAKASLPPAASNLALTRTERAGIHTIPQLLDGIARLSHSSCPKPLPATGWQPQAQLGDGFFPTMVTITSRTPT
jgi:hypothetical protein